MRRKPPEGAGGGREGRGERTKEKQIEKLTGVAEDRYLRETPAEVFEWTGELSLPPQKGTMALGGFRSAKSMHPQFRWLDDLGSDVLRHVPEDRQAMYVEATVKCTVFRNPNVPVKVEALSGTVTNPSGDRTPATKEQLEEAAGILGATTENIWRNRGGSVIEQYDKKFAGEDEQMQQRKVSALGDRIVERLSTKEHRMHISGVIGAEPKGRKGEQERFRKIVGLELLMKELDALEKGHKEAYEKVRAKLGTSYFELKTSPTDIRIKIQNLEGFSREVEVSLLETGAAKDAIVDLFGSVVTSLGRKLVRKVQRLVGGGKGDTKEGGGTE